MSITTVKAEPAKTPAKKPKEAQLTVVPKTIRGDTYLVMADAAITPEDEFVNLYFTANQTGGLALRPPFDPKILKHLVQHNNILSQCVEAMSVNIDSTGHEFIGVKEGVDPNPAELESATEFFNEPFPGLSFVGVRRDLRNDIEAVGYGFLEILRAMDGSVAGFRNLDVCNMRLVKLDDPVSVERTIQRGGKEITLTFMERERRFMQSLNGKTKTFYKEFGSSRALNKTDGRWETKELPVPPEQQATEVLMFGVNKDVNSPYYLPRWINQMPSVVGSRKAEEQNLEFFDAGGMPPAIIFIQGGAMVGQSSDQLRTYLSAQNKNKGRAIVVELQSSSGSLESSGSVSAKVERFGSQQANDSMFQKYDVAAEDHVRVGFRLPPLFLGKAADYNFATAQTSYMVAEAQVFQPERSEFDELINKTLIKALGFKTLKIRSNPITLKSVENQLAGITLVADKVAGNDIVTEVNKITGLTMEFDQAAADHAAAVKEATLQGLQNAVNAPPDTKPKPGTPPVGGKPNLKAVPGGKLSDLAKKFAHVTGRNSTLKFDLTAAESVAVVQEVDELSGADLSAFNEYLSGYSFAPAHTHDHG